MVDKIKKWIEDNIHKKWLKVVVIILAMLGIGFCAWFGVSSCASFKIDSLKVRTDKVEVETDGVDIQAPSKNVSLEDVSEEDWLNVANYIYANTSLVATDYNDLVKRFADFGLTPDEFIDFLGRHGMIALENGVVYVD